MSLRKNPILVAAGILVLAVLSAQAAPKKDKSGDRSWVIPDFASRRVDRIAMMPVASYDNDLVAEKKVEGYLSAAIGQDKAGYRWISAGTVREMLRGAGTSDSLVNLAKQGILKGVRVDSLLAPALCAKLRCQALLSVRVDQWEQQQVEIDQSGKPSTTVQLKGALVDSTGTQLWWVTSSESAEGPYHDAGASPIGNTGSALNTTSTFGQSGAPDYVQVVTAIGKRWSLLFPSKPVPAAAPAESTKSGADTTRAGAGK